MGWGAEGDSKGGLQAVLVLGVCVLRLLAQGSGFRVYAPGFECPPSETYLVVNHTPQPKGGLLGLAFGSWRIESSRASDFRARVEYRV